MRNHSIPRQARDGEQSRTILALAIIALLVCTAAEAKYSGGMGEPNDPYQIATAADLNDIGNHKEDWNKHFVLVNDVNLAEYTGTQFKIIGNPITMFMGVFDGNDHKILNFTWSSTDRGGIGLFGYVSGGGQVKNIRLENISITTGTNSGVIGGLVGSNKGSISNCFSTGAILSGNNSSYIGGLGGDNDGGNISHCFSAVTTTSGNSSFSLGGLLGYNSQGNIINCFSTGDITGGDSSHDIGGLAANNYEGNIINCHSTGTITVGNDAYWIGGLVGFNWRGTVTSCYSQNAVEGTSNLWGAGGLVGVNDSGTIGNCFSTGAVTGDDCLGGLVGDNSGYYGGGYISDCYSTGIVTGGADPDYFGGMVGWNNSGNISSCFFLVNSGPNNGYGTPLTDAQMKQQSSFIGWDFTNEIANGTNDYWRMCVDGVNYPHLNWEYTQHGDFTCPDGVDFIDFAILASAWQTDPNDVGWNAVCDISQPKDNFINECDLAVFCENWLEGTGPY